MLDKRGRPSAELDLSVANLVFSFVPPDGGTLDPGVFLVGQIPEQGTLIGVRVNCDVATTIAFTFERANDLGPSSTGPLLWTAIAGTPQPALADTAYFCDNTLSGWTTPSQAMQWFRVTVDTGAVCFDLVTVTMVFLNEE